MSSEVAVAVEQLTKTYRVGVGRARVREMTPPPFDRLVERALPVWWRKNCFDAVADVSFEVPARRATGLIGHNGSGKTTLLKLIAGVTEPTRGTVTTQGRVAALLDVVVGFHPELTGRENLALVGGIYGLDRKTMARRSEAILDFAEITEMLDTPVKRYSAGMVARLGFATITAVEPSLLLIDEVLAVGDAAFQRKCIEWLETYSRDGGTLLFVSHNLGLIRSMTEHVIWLDHGAIVESGATGDILPRYARAMERREGGQPVGTRRQMRRSVAAAKSDRWGTGGAHVEEVHVHQPENGSIRFEVMFQSSGSPDWLVVSLVDEAGHEAGMTASSTGVVLDGAAHAECTVGAGQLIGGTYFPVVAIVANDGKVRDRWRVDRAVVVEESAPSPVGASFGSARLVASWRVDRDVSAPPPSTDLAREM